MNKYRHTNRPRDGVLADDELHVTNWRPMVTYGL
jgi:hypothetical protein